jgi:glycosyltransferase involved in cell wall biosynthesis
VSLKSTRHKLLYVAFSGKFLEVREGLMLAGWEVDVMSPWSPSRNLRSLINKVGLRKLATIFSSREVDTYQGKKLGLGIFQFYAPIKARIQIPLFFEKLEIQEYCNRRISKRIARKSTGYDAIVIPGDYIEYVSIYKSLVVVEFRSHHPNFNVNRPDAVLDYPITNRLGTWPDLFERNISHISKMIVYSNLVKNSLNHTNYPQSDIHVIPLKFPVVDPESNQEDSRNSKVLYVGREDFDKGLDLAVKTTRQLKVDLIVVGKFSRNVILWLEQFPHVNYLGFLNRSSLYELMKQTEVFIIPSIESFGLAMIEALSCGMKVVTTANTGAVQFIHGSKNLFLSEDLSVKNLVETCSLAFKSKLDSENNPQMDCTLIVGGWEAFGKNLKQILILENSQK